jgi:DNA polymerase
MPFLRAQVRLINPEIIVCLGATALKYLIGGNEKITQIRGNWIKRGRFLFMPTFHPAALLRDPGKNELMWQDFKKVKNKLDEIK